MGIVTAIIAGLFPLAAALLWIWGLRQIVRKGDLDNFIAFMNMAAVLLLVGMPILCLIGATLHYLIYRDEPLLYGLGTSLLAGFAVMALGWFLGFGVLSIQLNMILYRYFREERTIEQREYGTDVRWWTRRWARLHRWMFRRRGMSVQEVLDRVVPENR